MPILKKKNEDFFSEWSSDMAYVLGFFIADGSMYINKRGSRYVSFYSNDKEIIEKIRSTLKSENKITARKSGVGLSKRFVLQIGSRRMYEDLERLGLCSNKSKTIVFPFVPKEFISDFVRGYFDGDGNVLFKEYFRKDRQRFKNYFATKFISGSIDLLKGLRIHLADQAGLGRGSLFRGTRSFVLSYAMKDSEKLFAFMYKNAKSTLHLKRKRKVFEDAILTIRSGSSAG